MHANLPLHLPPLCLPSRRTAKQAGRADAGKPLLSGPRWDLLAPIVDADSPNVIGTRHKFSAPRIVPDPQARAGELCGRDQCNSAGAGREWWGNLCPVYGVPAVLIKLRSPDRLRGPRAIDIAPVLSGVLSAVRDAPVNLTKLRVVCDWLQYKENFRDPLAVRKIEPSAYETAQASRSGGDSSACSAELAIDLRRARSVNLRRSSGSAWRRPADAPIPAAFISSRGYRAAVARFGISTRSIGVRCRLGARQRARVRAGAPGRRERCAQRGGRARADREFIHGVG